MTTSASEMPPATELEPARAGDGDLGERGDDADDGAEQTDERRHRADRRQHAQAAPQIAAGLLVLPLDLAAHQLDGRRSVGVLSPQRNAERQRPR